MNHAQELITILVAPSFEVVVACTRACAAAGDSYSRRRH